MGNQKKGRGERRVHAFMHFAVLAHLLHLHIGLLAVQKAFMIKFIS